MGYLNNLANEIYDNSTNKGFYDKERDMCEVIVLMHSELSEAIEEYRNDKPALYYNGEKPEGIAVELADCLIRILDTCAHMGYNIDEIVRLKMEYNKTRPYRHGGKKI